MDCTTNGTGLNGTNKLISNSGLLFDAFKKNAGKLGIGLHDVIFGNNWRVFETRCLPS